MLQRLNDSPAFEIVALQDFRGEVFADGIAVEVKVMVEVMLQHHLESVELCLHFVVEITLGFGSLLQLLEDKLACAVVLKPGRVDETT